MFWDRWFKKGKKEGVPQAKEEETPKPSGEEAKKADDGHGHADDEEKKVCKFC